MQNYTVKGSSNVTISRQTVPFLLKLQPVYLHKASYTRQFKNEFSLLSYRFDREQDEQNMKVGNVNDFGHYLGAEEQ